MIKEHILVTDSFLNSLQYKLKVLEPLLTRILVGRDNPFETGTPYSIISGCLPDESFREYAFKNLTYNFFNEVVHDIKYRGFIDKMFYYLLFTYRELEDIYGNNGKTAKEAVNNLYTVLRFCIFLIKTIHERHIFNKTATFRSLFLRGMLLLVKTMRIILYDR